MSKVDSVVDHTRKEPSFRRITPGDGAKYIEAMITHCLSSHPEIVSWPRGSIDPDMLEFPAEFLKRDNLARLGGTYKDAKGITCTKDLTLAQYRVILKNEVKATDASVEWTDRQVSKVLYPTATAKARADKRARINLAAQALLNKAMLLWPAQDVKDLMSQDVKLTSAYETGDLIAFINIYDVFCVSVDPPQWDLGSFGILYPLGF